VTLGDLRRSMNLGTLLIRADASLAIGTGHVMRCVALAQAWQDAGGTVCFAAAEMPDALSSRLIAEGVSLNRIYASPGGPEDASVTCAQARQVGADWVVIDGDRFGSDFLETVRAAGFCVLLIDDFAAREYFPVDLIVNPNLDDDEGPYRKRGATARLLMGPSYVLLRREFRERLTKREIRQAGNRVLVTLGGSDPENLTSKIVDALAYCSGLEVTVVVGAAYEKANELQELKTNNVRVLFNPPNMAQVMRDSDQAIIAAGGTLWELLFMGCAVLSYSRNLVQTRVAEALSQRGVLVDMGETRNFDKGALTLSVKEMVDSHLRREYMTNLAQTLVDGGGTKRVVAAAATLCHKRV